MAMLRNMVSSLIVHNRIRTTLPKAKAASRLAEKMVTWGKRGDEHAKTQAMRFLREHRLTIPKLFNEMADRYRTREGGYTRIHKLGYRDGDNAPMAVLEYVDTPEDLKYSMLIKRLARIELEPSLRVSPTIIEDGQAPKMEKRDFKKSLNHIKGQKKFDKNVEKMMKSQEMSKDDLDKKVSTESCKLRARLEEKKVIFRTNHIKYTVSENL
ncbi:ribosomal protein L17 [Rhizophagus irregularis DAOM 181602=DAOM 197198]|uniref:Ribosomal protein L17 n=1 Tax=Rhizophagus irregularis (strain DAOM 181602 / DAOM 197198 / MUCL 43194) TaxID=747089 RepID=A0A2P4Q9R3_RHIID|nr:ribosomal protein L17 [Rhizophagus irregularis DAOM 181602=DAOM 197198]POG74389.1 ribosomal protein L17 [Rhizophagus irregularis DAOM 181602=DAOM 197198]|eukprot:XP_025181255.1 ribosomal protein L17 [Rhizophagus irregularis DAOM 181602=DAOM 197198]